MSKGAKPKRATVAVDGDWFGVPVGFFRSRACAELSPLAVKMLFTLMAQLRSNHFGNGRVDAHARTLKKYGWTSQMSAYAALRELEDAGLLVRTRRGFRGSVGLFGITLFPMHCESKGLEVGPGAWAASDWRKVPFSEEAPTDSSPARWHRPRSSGKLKACSRRGSESIECAPATGVNAPELPPCRPAAVVHEGVSDGNALPQRVSPLREAIC
ncbi:MAG: hypothetical protein RI988_3 [Pseudomonadota bacterium]|jgi:hypothetical protein